MIKNWKRDNRSEEAKLKVKWRAHRTSAKRRGIETEVTFEEYQSLMEQEASCFYCDASFSHEKGSLQGRTIDREDNDLPYSIDNIVLSCRRCNIIKGNWFSLEEMSEIAGDYLYNKDF